MKITATMTIINVILLLAGCGQPTVDTSSDEAMKSSIEKVKASLPEERREKFEDAIKRVAFNDLDFADLFQASQFDTGAVERKIKESLSGKTGEEIIVLAEQIRSEEETERRRAEELTKAKMAQILELAEDLHMGGDFDRALVRYREVLIYDPQNAEVQDRIVELERLVSELEGARFQHDLRVQALLAEASALQDDEEFLGAMAKYQEALSLDGESREAVKGITDTKAQVEIFKSKAEYLPRVKLYEFEASTIDTFVEKAIPSIRFKLKNEGDKTLVKVEVTVYMKDVEGNIIAEKTFHPVLVTRYSFGDNKSLKPGYIWQLERGKWYTIKDAPSEWDIGNAEAKITDIEFED